MAPLTLRRPFVVAILILVVVIGLASAIGLAVLDEPLRRYTEARMNASLQGYAVTVRSLHLSPLGFSIDLRDIMIAQDEHPDPPVAVIDRLRASVHWRALLAGRVVGDVLIDHPVVDLNRAQAAAEITDPTPVEDKGWQQALQAIYPLKINQLRVTHGDVTYRDRGQFEPLRMHDLEFVASNIRNVHSEEGVYPSPMRLEARVFDHGAVTATGWADFLAEPYMAFSAVISLDGIELEHFRPIAHRYHLDVEGGTLSAAGRIEIAPAYKTAQLWTAVVDGARIDYVHTAGASAQEKAAAVAAGEAARGVATNPGLMVRIDRLEMTRSTVGMTNRAVHPAYRVFLTDASLRVSNLSSIRSGETARARLSGRFMGTGIATAAVTLLPERPDPDLDLTLRIDDTSLASMNDLLRAYGNFDVVAGRFSLYSEASVREREVTGYVKPLFQDMVVYDRRQDRDKGPLRKLYEGVVGGLSRVLRNRPRDEVATRADLSGRLGDPKVSALDAVLGLIQNAFFKAILPGFEARLRPPPPRSPSS
jgi:Domain of Unknown Function (DUF748)